MSVRSEYFFTSSNGKTLIHVNQWTPVNRKILGVVQIAHGVAEYGARYAPFAEFLCGHGFVVVANDHLGHGKSLIENRPMVYLGDENGWEHVVDDMEKIRERTAKVFPEVPYFLFGHSMGSFLARTHLIRYPGKLSGCILCGTGHMSGLIVAGGKFVADSEIRKTGAASYSQKADTLAFGAYNKRFAPNRTAFDWISLNEENVDAYIADPLCGGKTTLGLFRDMMGGIAHRITSFSVRSAESTSRCAGGSPQSGISRVTPPCMALSWATRPGKLYRAACQALVGDSLPLM